MSVSAKVEESPQNKQKVLHVITGLRTGGAERMLYNLLAHHDKVRFNFEVVSLLKGGIFVERIEALGIKVHVLNMNGLNIFRCMRHFLKILHDYNPLIVSAWMPHANFFAGSLTKIFLRKAGIIWNVQASNLPKKTIPLMTIFINYACALLSNIIPNKIIYNSEAGRKYHEKIGFSKNKKELIFTGIDINSFKLTDEVITAGKLLKAKYSFNESAVIIGTLGRWHPMKDYQTFIKAARIIKEMSPQLVQFLMCGYSLVPNNQDLMKLIHTEGLTDDFILAGPQKNAAVGLQLMDIYVSSSNSAEGASNSVIEAMAMSIPCIVTDVGDSAYLVDNKELVANPSDPKHLAQRCLQLIQRGAATRESMGKQLQKRVQEHFLIEKATKQFETIYRELI